MGEPADETQPQALVTASAADTARALAEVVAPTLAKGVIIRRPRAVALAERWDADGRAVERLRRLRGRYGPAPLRLATPGRDLVLLLDAADVRRVLNGSPEPFAVASTLKRSALAHFQPAGVLASHGPERAARRRLNEQVLDPGLPVHRLAGDLLAKVAEEGRWLAAHVQRTDRLTWPHYAEAWWRAVRRMVLGDAARDDHAVTDLLADLRAAANFALLHPGRTETRRRFLRQLQGHLDRAEPGSLAALLADAPADGVTRPTQQVPQWLFAFDAAAWASYRALAALVPRPELVARARAEASDDPSLQRLDSLRAAVLESLRLWPTTPLVLREPTEPTPATQGATLPAGATVAVFAPLFHRDPDHVVDADGFAPDRWMNRAGGPELGALAGDDWPLIPFSAGPAVCPGRSLVLLSTSAMLGTLLSELSLAHVPGQAERVGPGRPLPGTLDPFSLVFLAAPAD